MSIEEAARGFPYPPLLWFASDPAPSGRRWVIEYGPNGPDSGSGWVLMLWRPTTEQYDPAYFDEHVDAHEGSFALTIRSYRELGQHPPPPSARDKVINVRGVKAWMWESYARCTDAERRDTHSWRFCENGDDLRNIVWTVAQSDGGYVTYSVAANSRRWTEQQTIDIVNSMVEVRG